MTGTITHIRNHGTIVSICIESDEGGTSPIFFDHSAFRWLLEGEQCTPADLIGKHVRYDGESVRLLTEAQ